MSNNPDYEPTRNDAPIPARMPDPTRFAYTVYFSWNHPTYLDYTPMRVLTWSPPWRRVPQYHVPVIINSHRVHFPTQHIRAVTPHGRATLRRLKTGTVSY